MSAAFTIEFQNQQSIHEVDLKLLRAAIEQVLFEEQIASADISVAIVDDVTIHRLNNEYLGHDYPTDVISFLLNPDPEQDFGQRPSGDRHVEAELIVSAETAVREAANHKWGAADELLLYVIHGTLHLCGYDDLTDETRPLMRARERELLSNWHLTPTGLEA